MSELDALLKDIDPNNFNAILSILNKAENLITDDIKKIHISFLRNCTIEPIIPFLKFYLYRLGIKPESIFGNFDSIQQEILSNAPLISDHRPEIIVLSLHYSAHDIIFNSQFSKIEELQKEIENIVNLLAEKTNALILINTLIPPFYSHICTQNSLSNINNWIREYVLQHQSRFFLMDWERYVRILGEENSMDYRYWYRYQAPFKNSFLNLYAQDISKVIRALTGGAKKCLVLDCDNTLWGGVIGEDGIDGIKLDNHHFPGKIFFDFQKTVLNLQKRGVILALCSKNNSRDVWHVFEKHPHCVLKKDHFAVARINWKDKVANILSLAKELNLNLDSFVFVDDNPMECELVKKSLPAVIVLTVPSDLYRFPQLLWQNALFDTLSVNAEDSFRTSMYHQENKRKEFSEKFTDIDSYLSSLELELTICSSSKKDISRISQLTQKTNQFNLSVKRYSEHDILSFMNSDSHAVFSVSAKDKFGQYGLTGVLIALKQGSIGIVDSVLLSCRILSRKIEHVFLSYCLNSLSKLWKVKSFYANYTETDQNSQIKIFLNDFGFIETHQSSSIYKIDIADDFKLIEYIKILEAE